MLQATVRLDAEDRQLLDQLAADHDRKQALHDFFEEWEAEAGPASPDKVAAMAKRRGL